MLTLERSTALPMRLRSVAHALLQFAFWPRLQPLVGGVGRRILLCFIPCKEQAAAGPLPFHARGNGVHCSKRGGRGLVIQCPRRCSQAFACRLGAVKLLPSTTYTCSAQQPACQEAHPPARLLGRPTLLVPQPPPALPPAAACSPTLTLASPPRLLLPPWPAAGSGALTRRGSGGMRMLTSGSWMVTSGQDGGAPAMSLTYLANACLEEGVGGGCMGGLERA